MPAAIVVAACLAGATLASPGASPPVAARDAPPAAGQVAVRAAPPALGPVASEPHARAIQRPQLFGRFAHPPLDGPLVLTGTFGEYRPGRFHAGLDFSTGERVGLPAYAPLDGFIERVRASGAGYGRSLYLHVADGRLIVLAHLDAFDEPLASFVAAAQDSSGQYEQDLWPPPGRMIVHAGQRLGWSGQSGIGEPHLHLEVRRGDMAINPLLAGAEAEDATTPVISTVAIEPRDATSLINGTNAILLLHAPGAAMGPETPAAPGAAALDTITLDGLARVAVEAHDPGTRRADMAPYEIEMSWNGRSVTCRFDSLSWATDMPEGEIVYDRGRALPAAAHGVRLCVPSAWRPRVIRVAPENAQVNGTLGLVPGDSLTRVHIVARDFAGHEATRDFLLRARSDAEHMVLDAPRDQGGSLAGFRWNVPAAALFEGTVVTAESLGASVPAAELRRLTPVIDLKPWWLALRSPATLRAPLPEGAASAHAGLCVNRGGEWEWMRGEWDSTGRKFIVQPTHLGRFALCTDEHAPQAWPRRVPARDPAAAPYSRWALECGVNENGSGLDARGSYFTVDGRRRPSEWDAEKRVLRWRPRRAPARGAHSYGVTLADRAGNMSRMAGRFVLD